MAVLRYKQWPVCSGIHEALQHDRPPPTPPRLSCPAFTFAVGLLMWPHLSNLLLAGNVGIMVFFTVAVAPTIFTALPPEWSAAYVRKFFPKYFFFLGVTTAAATATASGEITQAALLACAVVFFFSCFWLTPRINRARDEKRASEFKVLHWLSVGLNMAQLITFIWLLLPGGRMP